MKEDREADDERIAWHPAFFTAIQQELLEYRDDLSFESEHQLNAEPLKIDVVIIKKRRDVIIKKNIAAIFRMYNIIEYKSPDDNLSVADFYKVYGYACLYAVLDKVDITEITISFVETKHPRGLLKHLKEVRGYRVTERWDGVYIVEGDVVAIQIIENKKLGEGDNLWLRSLRNDIDAQSLGRILTDEKLVKDDGLSAYLQVIMAANSAALEEAELRSVLKI
jgi:hypothetical protein